MPVILGKIIAGALLWVAGRLVWKVLIALGISVITFTGMEAALTNVVDYGMARLSGIPSDVLSVIGYMKIGVCVSMLSSAYAGRLVMKIGTSGVLKKLVVTG